MKKLPGARILDGVFTAVQQAIGTAKKNTAAAVYLAGFVEDVKASGFVGEAITRNKSEGVNARPRVPLARRARRMHDTGPGRPDADECLPYYFQYIDLVPDGHVLETLERQIGESAAYLAGFTAEQALRREAPKEWNAVEIVGHLVDVERASATARSASRARIPSCGPRLSSATGRRWPTTRRARSATS